MLPKWFFHLNKSHYNSIIFCKTTKNDTSLSRISYIYVGIVYNACFTCFLSWRVSGKFRRFLGVIIVWIISVHFGLYAKTAKKVTKNHNCWKKWQWMKSRGREIVALTVVRDQIPIVFNGKLALNGQATLYSHDLAIIMTFTR